MGGAVVLVPLALPAVPAGPEDIELAAAQVGFPAVIKPIAAAASMGVVRVDSLEELRAKVASTQKQLDSLYLDEQVGRQEGMTRGRKGGLIMNIQGHHCNCGGRLPPAYS